MAKNDEQQKRTKAWEAKDNPLADPNIVSKVNEWAVKYTLVAVENTSSKDSSNTCIGRRIIRIHVSHKQPEAEPKKGIVEAAEVDVTVEAPITVGQGQIVAHDNGTIAVANTDETTGEHWLRYGIERLDKTNEQPLAVKLPEAPHSLHVFGRAVYVGFPRSVGWVDFSSPEPRYTLVCERNMQFKAYDLFARKGNLLIAVDDIRRPYYADSFRLVGDNHAPVHELGFDLPSLVNGHYNMAAVTGDELLLTYSYSKMSGSGQCLLRLPLSELKLDPTKPPKRKGEQSIVEHRRGCAKDDAKTISAPGDPLTRWEGMAVRGNSVLLAAGQRGLLEVPTQFVEGTKAKVTKFGLSVHSVCVKDEDATWLTVRNVSEHAQVAAGSESASSTAFDLIKVGKEDGKIQSRISLPGRFNLLG